MEIVEGVCGVGAGDLFEDDGAAGVRIHKVGEVVNFVVDYAPEVVGLVVGGYGLAGEGLVRHGGVGGRV